MSIKYYRLAKDEELPDEFCVIRDIGGEPVEYTFYAPEAENAKLRELAAKMARALRVDSEWCDRECIAVFGCSGMDECLIAKELRELGIEVEP